MRSPEQLRLHRALEEIEWAGDLELDAAAQSASHSLLEPILITTAVTILAGFGRWQLAVIEGELEIPCIDCALNEDEALPFILAHHQMQRGWNDFVRIRLALKLKSAFQRRALDNMRAGGRHKGLANLPDPQRIDVRQEFANIAAAKSLCCFSDDSGVSCVDLVDQDGEALTVFRLTTKARDE